MKLKIYGADWCSPCRMTKQLCQDKKVDYEFFPIDEGTNLQDAEKLLGKKIDSIPKVFNEDGFIGGYNEVVELLK